MMILQNINWVAVLIAGGLYFALGALWYSPVLFARMFIKYRGLDPSQMGGGNPLEFGVTFLADLVAAAVLAIVLYFVQPANIADGILSGLLLAIGIAATSALAYTIYSGPHKMLWVIYTGYQLVAFGVMGALLAVWR
jgi:hypothetical protein